MTRILNLINGQLLPASGDQWLTSINPATGQAHAELPDSDAADMQQAVAAAVAAAPAWRQLDPETRADWLFRLADALEARQDTLARAECDDNGKPLWLAASVDIPRAVQNFRFFAAGLLHRSSTAHLRPGFLNVTLQQPLGVGGCISPWNLPLYLLSWKIAPALAAGNTVVAKPSEITPLTAFLLSSIAQEIELPAGVLNLVHGTGPRVGEALCAHPDVKGISFTGSTATGAAIARVAAPQFKKLSLEMGGKNAAIIFADCDYERMLAEVLRSSFSNQGQICLCTSRLLIERSLYERLRADLVAGVQALRVGDPLEASTQQGAVVSAAHQQKILSCLATARAEGARVLCGGATVSLSGRCADGYFVAPTVLEGLGPQSQTNQTEIFGPVITLQPFESEAEALQLANASPYGLACSIWTQNLPQAQRLSQQVEAGLIWFNSWMKRDLRTPFGGIKQSGLGHEGGWQAFEFWSETRNVCWAD
ncbi:MAG: aldehyde dehydrogenase [Candidatus Sericytochromatia bacterium]|nr:aldehyde dehydrogenase [Candidatus Sericytochromatia bacterium]